LLFPTAKTFSQSVDEVIAKSSTSIFMKHGVQSLYAFRYLLIIGATFGEFFAPFSPANKLSASFCQKLR